MPIFSIIFGDILDAFHGADPTKEVRLSAAPRRLNFQINGLCVQTRGSSAETLKFENRGYGGGNGKGTGMDVRVADVCPLCIAPIFLGLHRSFFSREVGVFACTS